MAALYHRGLGRGGIDRLALYAGREHLAPPDVPERARMAWETVAAGARAASA